MQNKKISTQSKKKSKKIDPYLFSKNKIDKYISMIQKTMLSVQKYKLLDKVLFPLIDSALRKIVTDRQREGKKIKQLIVSRGLRIEKEVGKIRKMIPKYINIHQSKIYKKFKIAYELFT